MKMKISLSTPMIDREISQFDLDDEHVNRTNTKLFIERDDKLSLFGHNFLRIKNNKEESLVIIDDGLTVLWINAERVFSDIVKRNTLTVKAVWRDKKYDSLSGLVRKVYMEHYLPMYKCLESSQLQRPLGRDMWLKLISMALKFGLRVYSYDIKNVFTEITSMSDLHEDLIWGTTEKFKRAKVYISTIPVERLSDMPSFSATTYELTAKESL